MSVDAPDIYVGKSPAWLVDAIFRYSKGLVRRIMLLLILEKFATEIVDHLL